MMQAIKVEALLRDGSVSRATISPDELTDFRIWGPPATVETPAGLRQAVAIQHLCQTCGRPLPERRSACSNCAPTRR